MLRQPCTHDITTLCSHGRLQESFHLVFRGYQMGFSISRDIIYSLLQACIIKKDIKMVRNLHILIVSAGFHWVSSLGDHIIRLLSSFSCLLEASLIFCGILNPTVYTWNAIIEAYSISSIEKKSISLYYEMQESGVKPDEVSFLILLKTCMSSGDVKHGALMHHEIVCGMFSPNVNTSNTILNMYTKLGCLDEARNIFDTLPNRNAVAWGTMFSGYAQHSNSLLTFQLYEEMEDEGVKPSKVTFLSFLNACGDLGNAKEGRFIHDKIVRSELASDVGIGNAMVDMYVKCKYIGEAYMIFKELPFQDIMSWTAVITGFSVGHGEFVLQLFEQMVQKNLKLTKDICLCVLEACDSKERTDIVYDKLVRHRFELDIVVINALVDVYGKLDMLQEVESVFDRLKYSPDDLICRKTISSCNQQSGRNLPLLHLLNLIEHEGIEPGKFLLHCILNTFGQVADLAQGRFLHCLIMRSKHALDALLCGSLIVMYVKCLSFEDAYNLFERLPYRDKRSWHPLIGEFIDNRFDGNVLKDLLRMQQAGIKPGRTSVLFLLDLCKDLHSSDITSFFHDQIIRMGLESDEEINDTLMDLHATGSNLDKPCQVFDKLSCVDIRPYRAGILNYPHQGKTSFTLDIYIRMQATGVKVNRAVFMEVLKVSGTGETPSFARLVHYSIIAYGFALDIVMGTNIVDMYSRLGELEDAQNVFDSLEERNVILWSTLITGYTHNGQGLLALGAYGKMQDEKIQPDEIILSCVLKSCAQLGTIEFGRLLNDQIIRSGVDSNVVIGSILVDMYAKSSSLQEAKRVFEKLTIRNIVTWSALIAGHALEGDYISVDQCLVDMEQQGLTPDSAIFATLLTACSQFGFLEEGCRYFKRLRGTHGDTLLIFEHYNCMVNLLGRLGCLNEAIDLLCTMPSIPDVIGWKCLLSGCKTYGNAFLGDRCFNQLSDLDPKDASGYMIMSKHLCGCSIVGGT